MALGNIVWWMITGIIIVALGIISYFITRTLTSLDEAVKSLTQAVQEMRLAMKGQEATNKESKEEIEELWETSDLHKADIEEVKTRVTKLETTHKYCSHNQKAKTDE